MTNEANTVPADAPTEYGIRWTVETRKGVVTKERIFRTAKARDAFCAKVEDADGFIEFDSYLN
jgi:hypothetical protein